MRHTPKPKGSVPDTVQAYWEYVPPHYGNGALYPLLVFWHGVGENGDGSLAALENVLKNGPPKLIEADAWPEARTFVVLSPQHAPTQQPGRDCPTSPEIDEFLQFALDNYELDAKRVYLTGLSCGAIGSWNYLGDHTNETVAAAALVCGDGQAAFAKAGCSLGALPIWALHGGADETVLPAGSEVPINGLNACATLPVDAKLSIYPGVGHDSWKQTYDLSANNDIYTWLMSHSKP